MKITDFEDAINYLDNCKSIFGLKGFYSMKLSDSLKHNKELLKLILKKDGTVFKLLSEEEKNDRELALIASLSDNKPTLKDFPNKYLSDKELVLNMVGNFGYLINYDYLDQSLKNDEDLIIKIIREDVYNITDFDNDEHIIPKFDSSFNTNKKVIIELIQSIGLDGYDYADISLQRDFDVISACFYTNPKLLLKNPELGSNKGLIIDILKHNWKAIEYVSKELRDDDEIAEASLDIDTRILFYLSGRLREKYQYVIDEYFNNIDDIATVAANWWLDNSLEYNKVTARGVDSNTKSVIESIFTSHKAIKPLDDKQKHIFTEAIIDYLQEKFLYGADEVSLVSGYHYDNYPLQEARKKAGIAVDFPWNVTMNITMNDVKVEDEVVYSKENNDNKTLIYK